MSIARPLTKIERWVVEINAAICSTLYGTGHFVLTLAPVMYPVLDNRPHIVPYCAPNGGVGQVASLSPHSALHVINRVLLNNEPLMLIRCF